MRIRVLGSVALEPPVHADRTDQEAGARELALSPRLRRLLAALTVRANAVVSVDALAEVMWGEEQPTSPEGALHNLVSRLRGALGSTPTATRRTTDPPGPTTVIGSAADGPPALLTRPPGYLLQVAPAHLDATRFERLSRQGRALLDHDPSAAVDSLAEALAQWHGPAYAEFADEDFARPEAARLEGLRSTAVEDLADALLALGRHRDAVPLLEGLLAAEPLRERAQSRLMLALYRGGQQAEALDLFVAYRERLADELGIDPSPELQRLQQQILRQGLHLEREPPPTTRPQRGSVAGNLPPSPPALIGREPDLIRLAEAVRPGRVLTLTGPGGVGKTSLALRSAFQLGATFPDGAWFCDLAALTAQDDLPLAVMSALGLRAAPSTDSIGSLLAFLRSRRTLLVLDNCEHLLGAAAELTHQVHRHCPEVAVLATSRAPLEVADERVWPVLPLPLPPGSAPDLETTANAPAVELFVERTRRRLGTFSLDDGNAAPVAEICRRLDGLPLALELAAARMATMSPADLADRLSWRFRLLHGGVRAGGERHRTLRALVDWSFDLLDQQHQDVFEMLSLFAGSFDLDDATRLVLGVPDLDALADEAQVADIVLGLADRSMVVVSGGDGGRTRYALLETLRAYGRERLALRGHEAAAHRAHAQLLVDVTDAAVARLYGPGHVEASATIARHLDELRAAHTWALAHDLELAARLVGSLALYVEHQMPVEVPQWAERTIEAAQGSDSLQRLAGVYAVAAAGARFTGDLRHADDLARRGLELPADPATAAYLRVLIGEVALFEGRLEDVDAQHRAVSSLGVEGDLGPVGLLADLLVPLAAAYRGDVTGASRAAEELEARAARVGAGPVQAWARFQRGEAVLDADPEAAAELLDSAVRLARDQGDRYAAGAAMVSAASVRARHGDPVLAAPLYREVVEHWADAGDWTHQWTSLRGVVDVLLRLGEDEDAAVLRGALLSRPNAAPAYGPDAERMAAAETLLRQRLGGDELTRLSARGARMSDDDVVGFARATLTRISATGRTGRS